MIRTPGLRFASLSFVAVSLLVAPAAHAQWTVVLLNPAGAPSSYAYAANGAVQGGYANTGAGGRPHAGLWNGTAASWQEIHPPSMLNSEILAMTANAQVGFTYDGANVHAALWAGTAESWVDLNPLNTQSSAAYAMWGTRQVGRFSSPTGGDHACVWGGSANSFVDIHPNDAQSSYAFGVDDLRVVGFVNTFPPDARTLASVWTADGFSWGSLNPSVATSSMAYATADGQQCGHARINGSDHAGIWTGTADSWIDLHPSGVNSNRSDCFAVSHGVQVGELLIGGSQPNAAAWEGTAASYIDLHALLTGTGFISSTARGVWKDANFTYIVGWAAGGSFDQAVLWRRANPHPPCRADVAGLGGTAGGDGTLTVDDLIFYLNAFFSGNLAVADIAGLGGSTAPDGELTPDDIIAFLTSFFTGC